jgi:hypothetical protein
VVWFSVVALIFSCVTVWPELRAMFVFRSRWAPILPPPVQIGDDYHYFVLMKKFDQKIMNLLRGKRSNLNIPGTITTQFLGFLIVWPAYRVGVLLFDRRVGILLVRASSRFFLALLAQLLISLLLVGDDSPEKLIFSTSIFLVSFLVIEGSRGVFCNLFNERHLHDQSYSNEMMRSYVTETTTPALLFGILIVLDGAGRPDQFLWALVSLIWLGVTAFVYSPTFVALGVFQAAFYMLEGLWLESMLSIATLLVFGLLTIALLRRDKMSAGLIYKPALENIAFRKAFLPTIWENRFRVAMMLVISVLPLLSVGVTWYQSESGSLFLAISIPIAFAFLGAGHISRIWSRGAGQVFALLAPVLLANLAFPQGDWRQLDFLGLILLITCGVLIFFYFKQQQAFLLRHNYMRISAEDSKVVSCFLSSQGSAVVTDSVTVALYVDLYSDKSSLLSNYSTQSKRYPEHVRKIVACLKACGWSESQVVEALAANVQYIDWTRFRPISQNLDLKKIADFHTLQYFATNREYNQDLIADGLYVPNLGWSPEYKSMLQLYYRSD